MSRTKQLKGECQHCGGHLSFPAEGIGLTATCPHCGQETELFLATPKVESAVPVKGIIYSIIALLILGGGTAALLIRLKHEQHIVTEKKRALAALKNPNPGDSEPTPTELAAKAGFRVSAIKLEKTQGTGIVHAVGTVQNATGRKCFSVKIDLDVLDASGQKIGNATDQVSTLEPKAEWKFNALVVESKAASATLASIKEDQ